MDREGKQDAGVMAYIAGFPPDVRARLDAVRDAIFAAAPQASEKMAYGIPTVFLGENLVHYAAFARHIGFYPGSSGIAAFADQLSGYKHAKGSVQFPLDQPVPLALIGKIVEFRVQEASTRKAR